MSRHQTSKHTKEVGSLQKGADFVKAYALGFDVNVRFFFPYPVHLQLTGAHRTQLLSSGWTISILTPSRSKMLKLCREITSLAPSVIERFLAQLHGFLITFTGRIAGQDGKTKFTIENASRTRIVLADTCVWPLVPLNFQILSTSLHQKNTHSWFIPKHQGRSRRHCISHPRIATGKGIRWPAYS